MFIIGQRVTTWSDSFGRRNGEVVGISSEWITVKYDAGQRLPLCEGDTFLTSAYNVQPA